MSVQFDKPYKSSSEQLVILKNRGLIIPDDELGTAMLEKIGYYSLINGYSKPFMYLNEMGKEKYQDNITINDIYLQYIIDYQLHNFLFPTLTAIENHLKTVLGDVVANYYGVNDKNPSEAGYIEGAGVSYLDISNYQYSVKSKIVLRRIKKHILETNSNPTAYYRDKKNHLPPWILFRNLSLWQTNSFYRMLQPAHKLEVCSKFVTKLPPDKQEITLKMFANTFELIREFRNCIAHGSRLYAFKSKSKLSFKGIEKLLGAGTVLKSEYEIGIGVNDVFGLFLSVLILLPSSTEKQRFVIGLEGLINGIKYYKEGEPTDAYTLFMTESKLPNDFIDRLKKATIL